LALAILADISIAAASARLIDGHTKLGVAAGDHAAIIWPLLCGMAKAKYHLLLCEPVSGEEAERIGLVSLAVPDEHLQARALDVAVRPARGAANAVRRAQHAPHKWARARRADLRCFAGHGIPRVQRPRSAGRRGGFARKASPEIFARHGLNRAATSVERPCFAMGEARAQSASMHDGSAVDGDRLSGDQLT